MMPRTTTRHAATLLLAALAFVAACSTTLVQPYDQKLFDDTEALFKKASAMIDDGIAKSPRSDDERAALKARAAAVPLASQPGHASQFEARYDDLATDADALILRALSRSQEVGRVGDDLQRRVEALIEQNLPSACPDEDTQFAAITSSLTVRNYIDLKCLLTRWKAQHSDARLTDSTGILKRSNWELRKSTLVTAVLAIERAEAAKQRR